ncbi:hypothetical protein T4A_1487 [Trichinella pseudospiralis]|uniref:Uncharacterized protein n=1 Tax=Trichinella pseudospiralis TaxID=6337 RepID=A0A0V1EDD5_TRIPS|nr:hypothetical protein T4A_6856 [Trichinella pseudospiralis]KRY71171.1 hypothetical protein T4A_1487 [Trichinella pseudospiralis]KRZ38037.1 hypothetical protein T4C_13181 [Trichinella pseudospiralis]KRZ41118.1 hypothetical protein T4C_13229 [Trichinella pseudospiralis]
MCSYVYLIPNLKDLYTQLFASSLTLSECYLSPVYLIVTTFNHPESPRIPIWLYEKPPLTRFIYVPYSRIPPYPTTLSECHLCPVYSPASTSNHPERVSFQRRIPAGPAPTILIESLCSRPTPPTTTLSECHLIHVCLNALQPSYFQ